MTFSSGDPKDSDYSFIGDLGRLGEMIAIHTSLTDEKTSHIHKYLIKKWGITD